MVFWRLTKIGLFKTSSCHSCPIWIWTTMTHSDFMICSLPSTSSSMSKRRHIGVEVRWRSLTTRQIRSVSILLECSLTTRWSPAGYLQASVKPRLLNVWSGDGVVSTVQFCAALRKTVSRCQPVPDDADIDDLFATYYDVLCDIADRLALHSAACFTSSSRSSCAVVRRRLPRCTSSLPSSGVTLPTHTPCQWSPSVSRGCTQPTSTVSRKEWGVLAEPSFTKRALNAAAVAITGGQHSWPVWFSGNLAQLYYVINN